MAAFAELFTGIRNVWSNMRVESLIVDSGIEFPDGSIEIDSLESGGEGQVIKTVGGEVIWSADVAGDNLYDADGSLTGNRILDGDGNSLTFNNCSDITYSATNDMNLIAGGDLNLEGTVNLVDPVAQDDALTQMLVRDGTGEVKYRDAGSIMNGSVFTRHIVVAQSGGDYDNIQDAITAAIALTPTQTNRVLIEVYAGLYDLALDETLVIPDHVNLFGFGEAYISRSAGGDNMILQAGELCTIKGIIFNITGPNTYGGGTSLNRGFINLAGNRSGLLNCGIISDDQAIVSIASNANHFYINCTFTSAPSTILLSRLVEANSQDANLDNLVVRTCVFRQINAFADANTGIKCDGSNGAYDISNCLFINLQKDGTAAEGAISIAGSSLARVNACLFEDCGISVYCAQINSFIHSCDFVNSDTYDIQVAASGDVFVSDCTLDPAKVANAGTLDSIFYDSNGSTGYNFQVDNGITYNNIASDSSATKLLALDGTDKLVYRTDTTLFSKVGYSGRIASGSIAYTTGSPIDLPYSVSATGSYTHGGLSWSGVLNHVVIPSGEPLRIYNVSANVIFDNTTAGWGYGEIRILLNGSIAAADLTYIEAGRLGGVFISHNLELAANDIIKVQFSSSVNGDIIANNGNRMCKFSIINVA